MQQQKNDKTTCLLLALTTIFWGSLYTASKVPVSYTHLDVYKRQIYGGSTSAKLFLNVREKKSLCYYASAQFVASKGLKMCIRDRC